MDNYYLPTSLWGLAAGMSLLLVLLACGIYLWYRSRIKAAIQDSEDVADLAAEKVRLESEIQQCDNWLNNNREELLKLDAEREEQERIRQELANFQIQTAEEQQKVDDLRKETNDLQNVVTVLAQDRDKLAKEKEELEREKSESEDARREMRSLIERYKEEKKKFDELLQNIAQYEIKQQSLLGQVSATETQLILGQKELKQVQERLAQAKADLVPCEEVLAEKQRAREDRDRFLRESTELKRTMDNLKREEGMLRHEVDTLKAEAGTSADIINRYADLIETKPKCLNKGIFPEGGQDSVQESNALIKLKDSLNRQGLIFSMRTLKAFHTSLKINKINPLTVLAGVSGTGKTLLPIKYAEAMGMHCLVVSVQPRWDSPQDLFGFYNYLEHKYKATELARALIRMDPYNFQQIDKQEMPNRLLLVLLDEMNLARVEYYFSEFLSKLELRRGVNNPNNESERQLAEIELETGPRSVMDRLFNIWVGDNVIFAGTMNEDESTQTLSDKVLDRANVIRFGKPSDRIQAAQTITALSQQKFLPLSIWNSWKKKDLLLGGDQQDDIDNWIIQINRALERIGRPFGHRVKQAMRAYVSNYPGVDDGISYKLAFSDQVEQKVIPKLRGIDLAENSSQETLDEICSLIEEFGDDELRNVFSLCKDDKSVGTFIWRGVTRSIES